MWNFPILRYLSHSIHAHVDAERLGVEFGMYRFCIAAVRPNDLTQTARMVFNSVWSGLSSDTA
jgi:hypothetical protein